MILASAGTQTLQLAYVVVLVVLVYYVLPRVVIPAIARWLTRRRGGSPPAPVSRAGVALMAVMLTAFVVGVAWNRDLGRPTAGVLLLSLLGVLFGLWRYSRRGY